MENLSASEKNHILSLLSKDNDPASVSISKKLNDLDFLNTIEKLKSTKRTGWLDYKVPNPESISDHMYRMSIMCLIAKDDDLNKDKCIKMALAHDMAECIVGDLTPRSGVTKEEKFIMEKNAMTNLCDIIGNNEIMSLWLEYEENITREAKFVKEVDKLEMLIQAEEYERQYGKDLTDFFSFRDFTHPWLIDLYKKIMKRRE